MAHVARVAVAVIDVIARCRTAAAEPRRARAARISCLRSRDVGACGTCVARAVRAVDAAVDVGACASTALAVALRTGGARAGVLRGADVITQRPRDAVVFTGATVVDDITRLLADAGHLVAARADAFVLVRAVVLAAALGSWDARRISAQ